MIAVGALVFLLGCASTAPTSPASSPPVEVEPGLRERLAREGRSTVMVSLVWPAGSPRDRQPWRRAIAQEQRSALACAGLDDTHVTRRYTNIPAMALYLDQREMERLVACPTVELLAQNHVIERHLSQSLPLIGASTARATMSVDGTGVVVAILDTGLDWTLSELGGCIGAGCKVVEGYDFADGDDDPSDCHGHGSNVAAIAAGTDGVAPGAGILAYKVFGGSGCAFSDDATLTAALDAVLTAADTYDVAAVNMSLGYSGYAFDSECDRTATEMRTSVRAVYEAGIALAVSAGNDGYTSAVTYPACLSRVVAVANAYDASVGGATYCTDSACAGTCTDSSSAADQIQCTSNGGELIDLAAPGTYITAGGQTMAGTSQAAPHVTGALALLHEAAPDATPDQLYRWVARSDTTVDDSRSGATYSYPRLDLPSAFVSDAADLAVAGGGASDVGDGTDGDGDGVIELGETFTVDLSIANIGPGDLDGATVTMSEDTGAVEIIDGDAALGPVDYADTAPLDDSPYDFQLRVPDDCAADASLTFTVSFSDDAGNTTSDTWTLPITCVIDDDADGALYPDDCDDSNSNISPSSDERCDGVDNDCDGQTDEDDAVDAPTWYTDADGDGHGDPELSATACAAPAGSVADGDDCDDGAASVFTGADERCDGLDDDCDGAIDDDAVDAPAWHPDEDGDGYGAPGEAEVRCEAPEGWVEDGTDCDDGDPEGYPGKGGWSESCEATACGCASAGPAGGGLALGLGLLGLLRRRHTSAVTTTRSGAR